MLDNQVYFMQMQLNMMCNMLLMMSSLLAKSTNTGTSTMQKISLFDALNPPDGVNSVAKVTLAFNSKLTSSKLATCPVATFSPTMAPVENSVGTSLGLRVGQEHGSLYQIPVHFCNYMLHMMLRRQPYLI